MLELRLDINTRDVHGETPLFNLNKSLPNNLNSAFKQEEVIAPADALALFENAGVDLFVKDKQGRGLLHVAARYTGRKSATRFELLVQKGLDAAMEDDQRRTALNVAATCDNQQVLKLFDKDNVKNKVAAEDIEYETDF